MNRRTKTILVGLMLTAITASEIKADVADKCFKKLPFGCFVTKSDVIPRRQTDAIGKKLGTPLKQLSNTYLQIHGKPIQVNILEAKTRSAANTLHKTISAMKGHPAFCLVRGTKVIEFCNAEASTAIKTAYELGFVERPKQIQYRITAHLATIDKADYMALNRLFNAFLQTNTRNPSKESIANIQALANGFSFGTSLILCQRQSGFRTYECEPKPDKIVELPHDQIAYHFAHPPRMLDVPYVTLKANIVCNDTGQTPTRRIADESLLASTPYWPVDDQQIQKLAKRITSAKHMQEEKVQAILEWLTPGKNIKSSGPTGSRWGVKQVLKQKYGHCWDSADVFVTLARAAGIPSRQVAGWLYGTSGHVWAEVLIDGKGWQQVDPTGGGKLDCGIYHIPYFSTETGEMPILYLSMPQIEVVEPK